MDHGNPGCLMAITGVSVDGSGNATLSVVVRSGNIPKANSFNYLMTVSKTTLQGGALNGTGFEPTAVSINALTGIGTLTYATGATTQTEIAQSGEVWFPAPEFGEACLQQASQAFAVQPSKGQGRGISWTYEYPESNPPDAISIQLEGASHDIDGEYAIIGTAQTDTSSNNHQITGTIPENVNFVRLNITSVSGGTSPTIAGTITQS
jgi:hypothetical protein